jgi:hypothetical protein
MPGGTCLVAALPRVNPALEDGSTIQYSREIVVCESFIMDWRLGEDVRLIGRFGGVLQPAAFSPQSPTLRSESDLTSTDLAIRAYRMT